MCVFGRVNSLRVGRNHSPPLKKDLYVRLAIGRILKKKVTNERKT